ncbi:hypothetical protein LJ207_01990 [Halanaerobium sp. Z-7514]|uniref:GRAM domain-containing protein n=1 Tax=Halanaerobium polyolivorans TaxID=2886943 RepID=A0AAW4WSJ9_9FIRM|nr:hypothetical protein [Halanaerobium polyolivorans]MCC3144087.1 hypothetical protein [Halanaerobium polyolivorans]RQD71497.1 MAG: hypothetical protein D5S01_09850 [Halanaerobium sp. MSAO_Bac5]
MQFFNQQTMTLLVPVLLVVLYFLIKNNLNKLKSKRAEELFRNYHKDRIIYFSKEVDYLGRESTGKSKIVKNGSLLLTSDELHFVRWMPKEELVIPLENIKKIEEVESFLGRNKNKPLLKIEFNGENGNTDSAAWEIDNMHVWKESLLNNLND